MNAPRKKILFVDDHIANLTAGKTLLKTAYEVYPAPSAAHMFAILDKIRPDLILLDIEMPQMNGYEAIKLLKANPNFADIPVIFLTMKTDEESELEGFNLGAADYMSKPFSGPLLLKRIENQLLIAQQKKTILAHADTLQIEVEEKTREILTLQNAILTTISDLVEFRDKYTGEHTSRTQQFMQVMLEALIEHGSFQKEIAHWNMDFILPSTQLHDVGKIAISDTILNKPGKLTTDEFTIMKSHVTVGIETIEKIMSHAPAHAFLRHTMNLVGAHHEKWDGTGYPAGLKGEEIPLEGRLMAIVDVYDALISVRPYKSAFSHEEAKKIIEQGRGTSFDPRLVDIFLIVEKTFESIVNNAKQKLPC